MDLKITGLRPFARLKFVLVIGFPLLLISSCAGEGRQEQAPQAPNVKPDGHNANATDQSGQLSFGAELAEGAFDAQSWRDLIPQSCQFFFDGCNNCRRAPGATQAACTRKACVEYAQPRCLDEQAVAGTHEAIKLTRYTCDDGHHFSVFYGEYRVDDQRVSLGESEIMLADAQTHKAHKLIRERSASGAKYSANEMVFWQQGAEAMLTVNGLKLYQNCRAGD